MYRRPLFSRPNSFCLVRKFSVPLTFTVSPPDTYYFLGSPLITSATLIKTNPPHFSETKLKVKSNPSWIEHVARLACNHGSPIDVEVIPGAKVAPITSHKLQSVCRGATKSVTPSSLDMRVWTWIWRRFLSPMRDWCTKLDLSIEFRTGCSCIYNLCLGPSYIWLFLDY